MNHLPGILLLLFPTLGFSQETIETYVRQHAVPLAAISPDSTNYADLEALGRSIGDARIVMLGEVDHGDGATFAAKSRIIKYLHEVKGFNVLLFESDFYALNAGWEATPKNHAGICRFLYTNVYPLWSMAATCHPLFYDYIPQTHTTAAPMQLGGFDLTLHGRFTLNNFVGQLDSLLQRLQVPIVQQPDYRTVVLPALSQWVNTSVGQPASDTLLTQLATIRDQVKVRLPAEDFWVAAIENCLEYMLYMRKANIYPKPVEEGNRRDLQMAKNLGWLASVKYPTQKIIVWAATAHLYRDEGYFTQFDFFADLISMGNAFLRTSRFRDETYVLGFTALQGERGWIVREPYKLPKAPAKCLERWVDPAMEYAFVDFKEYNRRFPDDRAGFLMNGGIYFQNKRAQYNKGQWNRSLDGVVHIKNMYPAIRKEWKN